MKKLLVALALLTLSTVGLAEDRYRVLTGVEEKAVTIVDIKTGDITHCWIQRCMVNGEVFSDNSNFKEALSVYKEEVGR